MGAGFAKHSASAKLNVREKHMLRASTYIIALALTLTACNGSDESSENARDGGDTNMEDDGSDDSVDDSDDDNSSDDTSDDSAPDNAASDDVSDDVSGDAAGDDADAAVAGGGSTSDVADASTPPAMTDPTQPTNCATQTLTLALSGTTSACGFELPPQSIDTSTLNVYLEPRPGDRRVICRVGGSGSCNDSRGWFVTSNQVALCDLTCGQFGDYPNGRLVAEFGCRTTFCRDRCNLLGETCGGGNNCCPGLACDDGQCVACTATGDTCDADTAGLCCSGSCDSEQCCYDFGHACRTSDDCCRGQCVDSVCGCAAPEQECDGACVDVTSDSEHCSQCNNACADGATCRDSTCVCDETDPTVMYCQETCVDTQTSTAHCGGCNQPCRADQVCVGGSCQCEPGLTECANTCVDTSSSWAHCGGCGGQCSSVEVCNNNQCVCRPDRLLCGGQCIDPMTNNLHCGDCDKPCNGQRRCSMGSCQ